MLGTLVIGTGQALAATDPVLSGSFSDSTTQLSGATSVATSGTWGYTTAYYAGRLTAIDLLDPAHPIFAGQSAAANSLLNASTVNIAGGYAYVASKNRNGPTGSGKNDDGTGNSLTILDIASDPAHPSIVGFVRDANALFGAYGIAVSGHYAFVAAQGCLSRPTLPEHERRRLVRGDRHRQPRLADDRRDARNSSLPAPWAGIGALKHATSVAISGNYAYVTAAYTNRLTVIDISNPINPTIVASLQDSTNFNFAVDVAVRNGFAYVADQASTGRFAVVDVSNPANPAHRRLAHQRRPGSTAATASACAATSPSSRRATRQRRRHRHLRPDQATLRRRLRQRGDAAPNNRPRSRCERPVRDRKLAVPEHPVAAAVPALRPPGGRADDDRDDLGDRSQSCSDLGRDHRNRRSRRTRRPRTPARSSSRSTTRSRPSGARSTERRPDSARARRPRRTQV